MKNFFTPYKGRNVLPGQSVQVYRNLKFKDSVVYSIRDINTGLVLGHASNLLLGTCNFVVSQAGRNRVLREKKKNVHAWIEGSFGIIHAGDDELFADCIPVRYNPYTNSHFEIAESGEPIHSASLVWIDENGCKASNIERLTNVR